MLVMTLRDNDPREHRRLALAGIGYLVVTGLLLALSIAIYNKAFTDFTTVTLDADRAGLQLAELGDVRYNGVLVGQIREISQTQDHAIIRLGLFPDAAAEIPSDIDASIMPTTLFGQKYVALVANSDGGPTGLEDGLVIPTDRVHTSVELGQVLSRLFPLLETVKPADLSATLAALATALDGRGEEIGKSLEDLDGYLTDLNKHLPTLQEDLRLLASVAHTYNVAAPDLVTTLGNLTVTSRTITEKKAVFATLFGDVTDVSDLSADILETNEVNAIRTTSMSRPMLELLDKYSPEYNCLLRGIAAYKPILIKTFENGRVKQYAEFPTTQRRGYDQRDFPEYTDKRGPQCWGLPDNPPVPWPGVDLSNGTNEDSEQGLGNSYGPPGTTPGTQAPSAGALQGLIDQLTGRPAAYSGAEGSESSRVTNALLAARSGRAADSIPALSTLMYSPMIRAGGSA
jgi:phospholipid/cholesterol/gamma-HCH transport system substrate-binding protein